MSWTQTDLDNLESAIANGALTVEVAGRRVTYRSTEDLLRARSMVQRSLSEAASGSTRLSPRYRVATFADD